MGVERSCAMLFHPTQTQLSQDIVGGLREHPMGLVVRDILC
jgi:hypothetical protein